MLSWLLSKKTPDMATVPDTKPQQTVTDVIDEEMLALEPMSAEDKPFYDLFIKQHGIHWSPNELDFSRDKVDYDNLPEDLRLIFDKILAFFASADSIVLENAILNFLKNSETLSIKMLYSEQAYFEALHIITYTSAIVTYITDTDKRFELIKSFKHDPLIAKREEWMCKHIGDDVSEGERLVAFVCAEGINFVSSFLFIFYLRSTGRFAIFADANQFIAKDEIIAHVQTGVMRFNRFYREDISKEEISKIVEESVNFELEFARALIKGDRVENLYFKDIEGHVKNLGNYILECLGVEEKWQVDRQHLPSWLDFLNLHSKANFYERPVTSYQTPQAVSTNPGDDVDF